MLYLVNRWTKLLLLFLNAIVCITGLMASVYFFKGFTVTMGLRLCMVISWIDLILLFSGLLLQIMMSISRIMNYRMHEYIWDDLVRSAGRTKIKKIV